MQVTEIPAEGLKRAFKVTIPADEIETRVKSRLERLAKTIRLPGFRPGKAPLPLLKKQYGRSILGEVLEQAVDEGSKKTIGDNRLRPALRPQVEVTSFDEGRDLEFDVKLEVLPEVPEVDLAGVELVRLTAEPPPERVEEALRGFAASRQKFQEPEQPRPAADGDQLTIDFVGRIDGAAFEGGTGSDVPLRLGSGSMIPGFEPQLAGASAGETREVRVTFPGDYAREDVRGKEAAFEVTVKQVKAPVPITIDEAWATELGFENLEEVRQTFQKRLADELQGASRARLKRALLDRLAETYRFDVPQGMTDLEFEAIWKQLKAEMERAGAGFEEAAGKSEDELKVEYRGIAERRVRLGLLLADIGSRNEVKVEAEELQQAVLREAMRYQGQERKVLEFFKNNPAAVEQLRAPLFEDKVCDFIFTRAKVTDTAISPEELMRDPDEEEQQDRPPAAPVEPAAAASSSQG